MAYLYIIYSEKIDRFYVGACIQLERRLHEHSIGHSKYTSTGIPWKLMYTEEYADLKEAKVREMKIKRMKSRKYIMDLIAKG